MDGDMTVVLAVPCEGSAEKVVSVAHEVNFDVFCKFRAEELLFSRIGGVKYEVINVDADVKGFASGRRVGVIDDARVETRIVRRWLEVHLLEDGGEEIVPVMR